MARKKVSRRVAAIVTIIAGILIIAYPAWLRWVLGLFLIVHGLMNLK